MNLRLHLCLLAALMSAIMLVGLTGCGQGSNSSGSDGGDKKQGGTLTIFAASSLIDAFGELGKTFEKQNEGVEVKQSLSLARPCSPRYSRALLLTSSPPPPRRRWTPL